MFRRINDLWNRSKKFGSDLLSDNHNVSLKRFIALLSFALFVIVTVVAMKKTLTDNNVNLLNNALKYLSGIIGVGIFGVAATDIFCKRD
jgi:hypothetical protein